MRKIPDSFSSRLLALLLGIAGCTDIEVPPSLLPPVPDGAQSFESDLPGAAHRSGGKRDSAEESSSDDDSGDALSPTSAGTPAPSLDPGTNKQDADKGSNAAERAIVEADVVQVSGTRLYALSRVAGLTVIDLTDLAQLKVLGRFRELSGTPFEMYLRDGVVLAMYSSWGEYVKTTEGKYQFVQTSKVVALDVADPAAIAKIGSFDIAGEVSDSRIVGDVMYVVGYQNGYCWGCTQNQPLTSVLSLNVKDPRAVSKVDELRFDDAKNNYGWSKRSITVTQKRMYVAGPEYGQNEPQGSTIQVIDIADPAGDLVEGATVAASGQISSRWQMDEHEGVLRVISQIPQWWRGRSDAAPQIQTFKVESSQLVTPLASVDMQIPKNETLRSVRYDGPRAYAITAEQMDPLFTIDLSDPLKPRQVGELEMPGWIYHMEPRGNRVIGLGYDQGNKEGAITVSVFDVTDLAHPTMLDRVNFGGDWAHLPEDQDRIHKAFKVLDERGLVLVPFDGWSSGPRRGSQCYSSYQSGVQLIDLAQDDLTLRGTAPARGQARRAIVQENKLLTVSDEAVDAFDITDRAQPAPLGRLTIARNVSRSLLLKNGSVARINENWYGAQNSTLDLVPLALADRPDVTTAELNLAQLLAKSDSCWSYTWVQQAFAHENQINLVYQRYEQDEGAREDYYRPGVQVTGVLTIDATDPAAPVVLSKHEQRQSSEEGSWSPFYDYYSYGYGYGAQDNMVRTPDAIVMLEQRYSGSGDRSLTRLRVVNLTDPKLPTESHLDLADSAARWGGLVVDGKDVLLSHLEVAKERGRFYLDRLDLTNPAAPKLTAKINIPGTLLHYDSVRGRMLTSQLARSEPFTASAEDCYKRFAIADYKWSNNGSDRGSCTGYRQTLHLVRLAELGAAIDGSLTLDESERIQSSSYGDGRVAAVIGHGHHFAYEVADCFGPCGGASSAAPAQILTLGGFDTGILESGRMSVGTDSATSWWGYWGAQQVFASGTRALVLTQTDAAIVDLTNPAAPALLRTLPLAGYPQSLHASGSTVILALGMNGVQRIDL